MKDTLNSSPVSQRVQNMHEYFFARANTRIKAVIDTGIDVINLGIGSPDLPPPEAVKHEMAQQALQNPNYVYPSYGGLAHLISEIKHWYETEYSVSNKVLDILPVAGSKEALYFITLAFVDSTDEVLIPNPGYPTYGAAVSLVGAIPRMYNLTEANGYLPNIAELERQDLSQVKMMWINYPHNPTGAVATHNDYQKILQFTRKHKIILVSDNPYSHVTFGSFKAPSILEIAREDDLVIEVDSLSKTYNLAGLRLAWIAGNASLMTAIKTVYSNIETGIFIATQKTAIKALQTTKDWIIGRNKVYESRISLALQLSEALSMKGTSPKGSLYVWAKIPSNGQTSEAFCFSLLEEKGIFITPGTAFGDQGEGFVRISLCQPESVFKEAIRRVT